MAEYSSPTDAQGVELTKETCDQITAVCVEQLRVSRNNKRTRLAQIHASEDLYFGIVPKSLRNPFNKSFPYMSGFVDHLLSKIDDPPRAEYTPRLQEDYKIARKYTALYEKESNSNLPHARWALKDRWVKKMAIFSGLGVYAFYTESWPEYRNCLYAVDYNDFHFEPGGGGDLETHLFCGQENIFKTKEELVQGAVDNYYDQRQVDELVAATPQTQHKDNMDVWNDRHNRQRSFGLDPVSNNYTGQPIYRLVQWLTTYKGARYYVLFDDLSQKWVRVKRWKEICPSDLYPYIAWQTHEEATTLMAKAPADDAQPIGETINKLLNQELYNREKINMGPRMYDAEMIEDVEALIDNRPDALIPVNTKGGTRSLGQAISALPVGQLSNTLDLVSFLDIFAGTKTGSTPSSQGQAERDKKVGIFYGELEQVEDRLGLYNKSYREAWAQIAYRLAVNAKTMLNKPVKVRLLGSSGYEDDEIAPEEAEKNVEFDVKITGGQEETLANEAKNTRKLTALKEASVAPGSTINPRWRDEQTLLAGDFTPDEVRDAFDPLPPATQELLSEAAAAIKEIVAGREPPLNLGANQAYMQKVIDDATDLDLPLETKEKLYDFALAHKQIVMENEARSLMAQMTKEGLQPAPTNPNPSGLPPVGELFNFNDGGTPAAPEAPVPSPVEMAPPAPTVPTL